MDWFYLFAVQGTLKSLVLHHSLKALILCYSAFFMVQLSHPLTISGKTIALTIQTFAGKVKSLIFSILSGFSWLFFQGATIFFFSHNCSHYSDFGAQESLSLFSLFFQVFAMIWWGWMRWSSFFDLYIPHQDHSKEKEMEKGKMFAWGGLTNNLEKKRSKTQRRKERHNHLNAEFQRIARRD